MIHLQGRNKIFVRFNLIGFTFFSRSCRYGRGVQWSVRNRDGRESSLVEYLKNNPSLLCVSKGGTCIFTLYYLSACISVCIKINRKRRNVIKRNNYLVYMYNLPSLRVLNISKSDLRSAIANFRSKSLIASILIDYFWISLHFYGSPM